MLGQDEKKSGIVGKALLIFSGLSASSLPRRTTLPSGFPCSRPAGTAPRQASLEGILTCYLLKASSLGLLFFCYEEYILPCVNGWVC